MRRPDARSVPTVLREQLEREGELGSRDGEYRVRDLQMVYRATTALSPCSLSLPFLSQQKRGKKDEPPSALEE